MQMNGMAELISIARYWRDWPDPTLVVAVFHNNDLNQVTWEMRAMSGATKFTESQDIPDVSYGSFAASIGLHAIDVRHPAEIAGAWSKALAADRPAVLDVYCDPDVPPIPPHATSDQMKDAAQAMLAGDPDAAGVIRTGVKQKIQEFLPNKKKS
jgi:pyruvate dehydrogenase (quinone)